jgi:hypothetical protein
MFCPQIKSGATIFMHRHEKAATKKAKKLRCHHEKLVLAKYKLNTVQWPIFALSDVPF